MSTEAENPLQPLFNYLSREHGVDLMENELVEVARLSKPYILSELLSELSDEKIEEMFPDPESGIHFTNANEWKRTGAKAIREFIKGKQNY